MNHYLLGCFLSQKYFSAGGVWRPSVVQWPEVGGGVVCGGEATVPAAEAGEDAGPALTGGAAPLRGPYIYLLGVLYLPVR